MIRPGRSLGQHSVREVYCSEVQKNASSTVSHICMRAAPVLNTEPAAPFMATGLLAHTPQSSFFPLWSASTLGNGLHARTSNTNQHKSRERSVRANFLYVSYNERKCSLQTSKCHNPSLSCTATDSGHFVCALLRSRLRTNHLLTPRRCPTLFSCVLWPGIFLYY